MKYKIITLGCKVNQFETQAIQTLLGERGHTQTDRGDAQVVIVNTCAVTKESERKSRQALRRLVAENEGALSAVCGCVSQIAPEDIEKLGADVVYGTNDKLEFVKAIEKLFAEREKTTCVDIALERQDFEILPPGAMDGRTRAYIKIQDGCDNFCAYCVIPFARGAVRSLAPDVAAQQARELAQQGFFEIVITGIEISSYGKDFKTGEDLISAITAVSKAAPMARIRLGSLETRVVTEDFCKKLLALQNICPHFHLSLQSGSDGVLLRMGRKYDTARFFESVELLRRHFPSCAITTDLIVGFPGEMQEEFLETLAFIKKCAFSSMHVFPYSIRPETRAARMENQISKQVKDDRAKMARSLADEMRRDYLKGCVGKTVCVLFETESSGHAENYCEVRISESALRGEVRSVLITGTDGERLLGKLN